MINRTQRDRYRLAKNASEGSYRICVNKTNKHVYAQIIDGSGKTLASSSSSNKKCEVYSACKMKKAEWVGKTLAEKFEKENKNKEQKFFFDRGGLPYHGVVKELAQAARKSGLGF